MKRYVHKITILLLILVVSISCSANLDPIEQLFKEQKFEEAISELNKQLFFNVTDIRSLHLRARSYEELGDLKLAIRDYERIIKLNPDYAQAYAGLGKILFEKKDYANAESYLLKAAMLDSEDFEILFLLGRAQLMVKKYESADNFFSIAKELNPKFPKVYFYQGMARAYSGDPNGCAASFNQYLKLEPDNLVGRYNRGFAYMKIGYLHWALEDFEAVLKANPEHLDAQAYKGFCMAAMGDPSGCELIQSAAAKGNEYAKNQREVCI